MTSGQPNAPSDTSSEQDRRPNATANALTLVLGKLMGYTTAEWVNVEISISQIKVLLMLHFAGAHTINQLAARLNIGAPTASHLVEKLAQAGLASRMESPTDRRVVQVHLTPQGHALADRLMGPRQRILTGWLSQLNGDQLDDLLSGLEALLDIIRNSSLEFEADHVRNQDQEE